ncbi:class I SAM-dependent methyltransferase [Frankia sp. Ag45/Mut15]|uniref:Class I SAM-dependent methyltransferase n=1 Tax=Frankia umida TaxID=573489 RepID=A0ABT0JV24_9ACTN|nr:class I SAM-dependent methyltransferase [Frankia umida]MCK9875400.1 class I SAM-dependent methyltransferase [Frankia umida]
MTSGYATRSRHYSAEIAQVPPPMVLPGLLRPGLRVAEMPSGTGHFLAAYMAAGAEVTLVDICEQMLQIARQHADAHTPQTRFFCSALEDLSPQAGPFDLIVMPNGSLNQLAVDTAPADLLTVAAGLLAPGGRLLAQVLAAGRTCSFYDPHADDGRWQVDRRFTDDTGQPMVRRRRQQHQAGLVDLDLELHRGDELVYRDRVTVRPLTAADLRAAFEAAGLADVRLTPGAGGLAELLAARPLGDRK